MTIGKLALCAAAAWGLIGLAAASAQQNAPAPGAAAPAPAPAQGQPPRGGGGMGGGMPPVDEAKLRAEHPELYVLPPVPHDYKPKRTSWGDPDFTGMWPVDSIGGLLFQRPVAMGDRVFLSDQEFAAVDARMEKSRGAAAAEDKANKLGMGNWVESFAVGNRTSLLIDPADGRLPALTPYGDAMQRIGRSSWVNGQTYDWTTDFDSWDRCVTRGFPASMLPFRYNNGMRILQGPGVVVVDLEMIHDSRIIYTDGRTPPKGVTNYMGYSVGHWEGNTLVVETSNIREGAAPLNAATIGGPNPATNTIPMSKDAHVTERFQLADANTLVYTMTYSDPKVWTKPYTTRMEIPRNDKYEFYEYACHEGDVQVRNYINSSRALRAKGVTVADQGPARE